MTQNWINNQEWTNDLVKVLFETCQRNWFQYGNWLNISEESIIAGMNGVDHDFAAWSSLVNICKQRGYTFKNLAKAMQSAADLHILSAVERKMANKSVVPPAPAAKIERD